MRETEPDSYRLLHGYYFEDRSIAELAEEIGISATAASHRLGRLRDHLVARLLRFRKEADES